MTTYYSSGSSLTIVNFSHFPRSVGVDLVLIPEADTGVHEPVVGLSLDEVLMSAEQQAGAERLAEARRELATVLSDGDRPGTLKELRLASGLSQADLARRLHTSQPYIARLESGSIRRPSGSRVRQLSRAFGVPENVVLDCLE